MITDQERIDLNCDSSTIFCSAKVRFPLAALVLLLDRHIITIPSLQTILDNLAHLTQECVPEYSVINWVAVRRTYVSNFAGSGENLPDIAKSCDASMENKEFSFFLQILKKQNSFLFEVTSCHFSVEVFYKLHTKAL